MDVRKLMHSGRESRWPAVVVVGVALGLYLILPHGLVIGPPYLMPGLEGALVLVLVALNPSKRSGEDAYVRGVALALIGLVNLGNVISVVLLVHAIVSSSQSLTGRALLYAAMSIWLTNTLVFGMWFWELDRGGPGCRRTPKERSPDFLYPQMTATSLGSGDWRPTMLDYLYVAFTNATAFSPTDTMPLSPLAKALMTAESLVSMVTVTMVAARAVNILH